MIMATIQENINTLSNIKADIKAAIIEKGVDAGDNITEYGDKILQISGGIDDIDYLCFEAVEDSAISLSVFGTPISTNFEYSFNKKDWTTWDFNNIDILAGNKLYLRGDNPNGIVNNTTFSDYIIFNGAGKINLSGNILTMFDKTGAMKECPLDRTFYQMFMNNNALYDCSKLYFPMNVLPDRCMHSMFRACENLVWAPEIHATTCIDYYSLIRTFSECVNLIYAPSKYPKEIENTTGCFQNSFADCTSLKEAPYLPSTTLVTGCYNNMFSGCTSLQYIKAEFTTAPSTTYCNAWVSRVPSTGCFIKAKDASWTTKNTYACPTGWTLITSVS